MSLRSKLFHFLYREYRFKASSRNPGIQRRIKIFREENPEIENLSINERSLENNETDFHNASTFYDQHISAEKKIKKFIEYKRIERKYFSPIKYPNLLTWAEKEQIRHLHYSEPSTWTAEKLALSFPATVEIIKKILKSQWAPMSESRIKKHDDSVSDNWKAIERGELKLPDSLNSHIKNFISRKEINKSNNTENSIALKEKDYNTESKENELSEFASIIISYKKTKTNIDASNNSLENNDGSSNPHHEMHVLSDDNYMPKKNKYYTLEELRNEAEKSLMKSSSSPSEIDEHFIKGSQKTDIKKIHETDIALVKEIPLPEAFVKHNNERVHTTSQYEDDNVMLKIRIPEEKKKKGSVYKLKDCYYDDNGNFLYKVPGLI